MIRTAVAGLLHGGSALGGGSSIGSSACIRQTWHRVAVARPQALHGLGSSSLRYNFSDGAGKRAQSMSVSNGISFPQYAGQLVHAHIGIYASAGAGKQVRPILAHVGLHLRARPISSTALAFSSNKKPPRPEELYPESFAKEGELVNPSGRIYAVRRPPDEADDADAGSHPISSSYDEMRMRELERNAEEAKQRDNKKPRILSAILLTVLLTAVFYLWAALYTVLQTYSTATVISLHQKGGGIFGDLSSFFGATGNAKPPRVPDVLSGDGRYSEQQLRAAHAQGIAQRWGRRLHRALGWCDSLGLGTESKKVVSRAFLWAAEGWAFGQGGYIHLSDWKRASLPIIAINSVIFLAWSARLALPMARGFKWEQFMSRHFLHKPSGRLYTMLTSVFSHFGALHFGFNNFALYSCGAVALVSPAFYAMTQAQASRGQGRIPEASVTPHFMAFFATAGLVSALVSHLRSAVAWRLAAHWNGLQAAAKIGLRGGLGASGAIYAVFAMTALSHPEGRLSLLFLPGVSVPIQDGMKMLLVLDTIGLLLRLPYFDHLVHLSGAAFGYAYYHYGGPVWEALKRTIYESPAVQQALQERIRRIKQRIDARRPSESLHPSRLQRL